MTKFREKEYYLNAGYIAINAPFDAADLPSRDSQTISYDRDKCSIGEEQRTVIANALHQFFEKSYDINPDDLGIHFSNALDEAEMKTSSIRPKGIRVNVPPHREMHSLEEIRISAAISQFNDEDSLSNFKTVKTDGGCFTARTWEDLVKGLNEQFSKLGEPEIQIDNSLFINK